MYNRVCTHTQHALYEVHFMHGSVTLVCLSIMYIRTCMCLVCVRVFSCAKSHCYYLPPPGADPTKCKASGPGLQDGNVGDPGWFIIETRDAGAGTLQVPAARGEGCLQD